MEAGCLPAQVALGGERIQHRSWTSARRVAGNVQQFRPGSGAARAAHIQEGRKRFCDVAIVSLGARAELVARERRTRFGGAQQTACEIRDRQPVAHPFAGRFQGEGPAN